MITTGATGFLITGLSAYIGHNILFFLDASEIQFFPQGLVSSPAAPLARSLSPRSSD